MAFTKEVFSVEELDEYISKIGNNELLIFKFSPTCPISASVESDLDEWLLKLPSEKKLFCLKINVIDSRPLSKRLAQNLNIVHQSPQVIWLTEDRKVKWYANHYDISLQNLTKNLNN